MIRPLGQLLPSLSGTVARPAAMTRPAACSAARQIGERLGRLSGRKKPPETSHEEPCGALAKPVYLLSTFSGYRS